MREEEEDTDDMDKHFESDTQENVNKEKNSAVGNIVTDNDLLNNLLAAAAGVMIFSMLMGIVKRR